MIKKRSLASGETRFDIEIRINGEKHYATVGSLDQAEKYEAELILSRTIKPIGPQTEMDRFLRMALT